MERCPKKLERRLLVLLRSDRVGCFTAVRMSAWAKLTRFARRFVHFKQVTIIGESATHLLCSNQFTVTVYLMLSDSLFGKQDYVNLTYPAKRMCYVDHVVFTNCESFLKNYHF
ncbi:hypothetical protein Q1695_003042 [Nippostrongylus brasiliensis]|nr:hypothetical protein Q1695_003042 [Nippostrongylus brasiliensis]